MLQWFIGFAEFSDFREILLDLGQVSIEPICRFRFLCISCNACFRIKTWDITIPPNYHSKKRVDQMNFYAYVPQIFTWTANTQIHDDKIFFSFIVTSWQTFHKNSIVEMCSKCTYHLLIDLLCFTFYIFPYSVFKNVRGRFSMLQLELCGRPRKCSCRVCRRKSNIF